MSNRLIKLIHALLFWITIGLLGIIGLSYQSCSITANCDKNGCTIHSKSEPKDVIETIEEVLPILKDEKP